MNKLIIIYAIIGVVIAAAPILSKRYGVNYEKLGRIEVMLGCTIVLFAWPILVFAGVREGIRDRREKGAK